VAGASVVVASAVRVMKEVMSVVKSKPWVLSRVVVKSSSVTKDVSIDVSADVNAVVVSRVVVSSAVVEEVSPSLEVWNEVSAVVVFSRVVVSSEVKADVSVSTEVWNEVSEVVKVVSVP